MRDKQLICPICKEELQNKKIYRTHMESVHGKKRENQCDICDKYYSHITSLRNHKSKMHRVKENKKN